MRNLARAVSLCLALAVLGSAAYALADDSSIKLISRGPRHDALAAMTYKPFDGELWSKLGLSVAPARGDAFEGGVDEPPRHAGASRALRIVP